MRNRTKISPGRLFSREKYKGTRYYLDTQKKYEIARTILYFGISLSLFFSGWFLVGTKMNLLTIVAVLGCLPASKSAVDMIMYLRYHSCGREAGEAIEKAAQGLSGLYDLVFTSYDKNYPVAHITVKGNTVCGYTEDPGFDEQAFYKHIGSILKADNYRNVSVKIFSQLNKYTQRLEQLLRQETEEMDTEAILGILKSVSL